MKTLPSHPRAFSMIEVTMALGIAVFGIITIFALLPTGLNLTRESSAQCLAVNILTGLASDIRNSDGAASTKVFKIPLGSVGSGVIYFDESGLSLDAIPSAAAIYKAEWSVQPLDAANAIPPYVHAQVGWPAQAKNPIGFEEVLVILRNSPASAP